MSATQLAFIFFIAVLLLAYWIHHLLKEISELKSSKRSTEVKHGKKIEQFAPLLESYPYDSNNFRFLGSPIDGVQFNEDEIIFIEVKTENSRLSNKQRNIKNLITEGKVKFKEVRI